jgi:chemotaxis protein histidine kinase CheA
MDDVDQSIASQNAIVAAIGGKLKTLRDGIATSNKKGENTLLTEVTPIVKGINKNLDIIRKMLDEAKNIKKEWATAKNQLATLGKEKAATSATLTKKDEEIAALNTRLEENQAAAVENHDTLTNQKIALEAANHANLTAKENVEAGLAELQQQSAAATQQQQAALQEAMAAKAAAEGQQQQAAREVAQTKADLGTSQQHAAKMQAHMAKLGDLKKHQAGLTAALNALNAEIDLANDDMRSLDAAHVDHLGAIKTQLQSLDEELRKIIAAEPGAAGSGGPGMGPGPGSGDRSTDADRNRAAIMATDTVRPGSGSAGSGDSHRRFLSRSGPPINQGDLDNIGSDTDDEGFMSLPRNRSAAGGEHFVRNETDRINALPPLRGTTDTPGPTPDPSKNYLGASPEDLLRQQQSPHTSHPRHTTPEEDRLLAQGLKAKSGPSPFSRSIRGGQRGGYIAVKKTRSKSSSSSGRRGTRRSSSSRSKSTRRRRHRGSSSSTRSSRR